MKRIGFFGLWVGVCTALLGAGGAYAQSLERAPYLQRTSTSETTVVWYTSSATEGSLAYGSAPDALTTVVPSEGVGTRHEVRLTDLTPGSRVFYAVFAGDRLLAGGDREHVIELSPPPSSREPFRVWVVGDSGTGGANQALVRDAMLAYTHRDGPDLFLHVGDMAYDDGTEQEFTENFYGMYSEILRNTTVWPAMGNHEGYTSDSGSQTGPYYSGYVLPTAGEAGGLPSGTEAYYSFDYANAHFIVLDSYDTPRGVDDPMLTWLAADLEATDREWIVAYWHHPPYSKGSHDSDTESKLQDMRENALPILEAGGVDLVLAGHSHIYERSYLLDGAYETPSTTAGILDAGDGRIGSEGPYTKGPDGAGREGLTTATTAGGTLGGSRLTARCHTRPCGTAQCAARASLTRKLK